MSIPYPNQTTGGLTCAKCGAMYPFGFFHTCPAQWQAPPAPNRTGWKCPQCSRVWAPHIDECSGCCPPPNPPEAVKTTLTAKEAK